MTLTALLVSVAVGSFLAWRPQESWPLLLVPGWMFVRMALNAIDGMLAREHDQKTHLGAILNELGDVVSDTALFLPFAWVPGISPVWVVAFAILALLTEMTGAIAVQIGAGRRYDGPMGKSDRAFVVGLLALLLGLGAIPVSWADAVFMGMSVLAAVTVLNRARRAVKEAS